MTTYWYTLAFVPLFFTLCVCMHYCLTHLLYTHSLCACRYCVRKCIATECSRSGYGWMRAFLDRQKQKTIQLLYCTSAEQEPEINITAVSQSVSVPVWVSQCVSVLSVSEWVSVSTFECHSVHMSVMVSLSVSVWVSRCGAKSYLQRVDQTSHIFIFLL